MSKKPSVKSAPPEIQIVSERHFLSAQRGGGQLRFEAWARTHPGGRQEVTRYSLAYVNPVIHAGDNGRVLGYDNAHDGHHRHYFGEVEPVDYTGYEDIVERFSAEWVEIAKAHKGGKK